MKMVYLRKIAEKTKWDLVRNEEISEMVDWEPIDKKLEKRQLNWFGHL